MSRVFYVLFQGCAGMKEQGQRLCPLLFRSCSFWTICHGVVYVPARIKEQGQRLNISAQRGNHLNWELRRDFNHSWHASPVFALNPDPSAQKTRTLPDWANQAAPNMSEILVSVTEESCHELIATADYLLLPGFKSMACSFVQLPERKWW